MVGRLNRRQNWLIVLALLATWAAPHAVAAQGSNGMAQGVVKDDKGNPVEGATVTFQSTDAARKIETKTNKKGEYFQIGLPPGSYTITAATADLVSVPSPARINASRTLKTDLVVVDKKVAAAAAAAAAPPGSPEGKANAARVAFSAAFDAGVAASNANRLDEALEKFTQAAELNPACQDCHSNIGYAHFQKKDYAKAEAAYLKANEIKPTQAAYSGLASVYTAQKKLDQAQAAMSKATELNAASGGGGGDADALFNQGVTLWNSGKIEDAKKQFQAAVNANPNHAEARYQLGMALVNEGNLAGAAAEWNTYLKLAPSGAHAAEVKAMLPSLK